MYDAQNHHIDTNTVVMLETIAWFMAVPKDTMSPLRSVPSLRYDNRLDNSKQGACFDAGTT